VTIRVLIADDQQLVRTGFRLILESEQDIDVVGEAANGFEAVELARRLEPDVILMDIRMPDLDGIEATRRLCGGDGAGGMRILILTTFDLDEYVFDAIRAGASGFLLKDVAAVQLANGVRMVAAGEALLAPAITRRLIEEFAASTAVELPPGFDTLTPRELEIFRLVATGRSNAEIGSELYIAETTVKTHLTRVLVKLGLRDRIQAVVLAYETGIVVPARRARPPG
jgi:DNA-binding NarL/FixJ family response regulator